MVGSCTSRERRVSSSRHGARCPGRQVRSFSGRALIAGLLCCHVALLGWSAVTHSPVVPEVNHLPAGLSHLYLGRFELFRVNPPLVRMVAALPVTLMAPATDWGRYDASPMARCNSEVGYDFFAANGPRALRFLVIARWACIPFSVLGGYICFRWARELYGTAAGTVALILWCFCPYILGHASLIMPDAHAAAIGVVAYYCYWRWLIRPRLKGAYFAGIVLGLAELSKSTLVVFYPLWGLTWCIYHLAGHGFRHPRLWFREGGMLLGMMVVSVIVINLGYGLQGSFRPIGEYEFRSRILGSSEPASGPSRVTGNRFAGTCLARMPVPLPADYVQGIDLQRWDFERGITSYLRGEWANRGWWYYYLYALAIKLPLGTLCLIGLSVPCCFLQRYRSTWRDEIVLLLPIVGILALVSSQTGFSIHSRYVLPLLPMAFIWCSKVARAIESRHRIAVAGAVVLLSWSVVGSLWCYPHSLSYFNELVGGPKGGHNHLLDSNIAWGQDLYFLKRWYDAHPAARPLYLACYGLLAPRLAGIESQVPPAGPPPQADRLPEDNEPFATGTGWYAIDVNHLHGTKLPSPDGQGGWQVLAKDGHDLTYFQQHPPVAFAGYSIYIYHITPRERERLEL